MIQLKALREAKGINQKVMAAELGIQYPTYNRYELGQRELPQDLLFKIADYFSVTTDCVLGREPVPDWVYSDEQRPANIPFTKQEAQWIAGIAKAVLGVGQRETYSKEERKLIEDYRSLNDEGKTFIKQTLYTVTQSGIYARTDDIPSVASAV